MSNECQKSTNLFLGIASRTECVKNCLIAGGGLLLIIQSGDWAAARAVLAAFQIIRNHSSIATLDAVSQNLHHPGIFGISDHSRTVFTVIFINLCHLNNICQKGYSNDQTYFRYGSCH